MTDAISLLERTTIITPERKFKSIEEVTDFFQTRKVAAKVYKGKQLSIRMFNGLAYLKIIGDSKSGEYPIRDSGMEGLLTRSGMGRGNFPMYVADDHLIQYNINYLFSKIVPEQDLTVIYEKNPDDDGYCIKSIMSQKYSHVDHLDVLDIIKGLKIEHEVHQLYLDKNMFRMSLTNPANKVNTPAVVGDISSVGVDLMNSEVGYSSLSLGQFVHRYWCANGASHIDESHSRRSKAVHRGNIMLNTLKDFKESARWYLLNGAQQIEANFKILSETEVDDKILSKVSSRTEKVIGKKKTESLMVEWQTETNTVTANKARTDYEKLQNNCYDLTQLITRAAHRGLFNEKNELGKVIGSERLGLEKVGGWMYNNPEQFV